MVDSDVFSFLDYKSYLNEFLRKLPASGHGFRSKMAAAAGCRVAYVSQVLNGHLHFSLEQGEGLNSLLDHTNEESDYFLLILQFGRAGTEPLRKRLLTQIQGLREERLVLKNRVDIRATLDPLAQSTYYSSWYYAAIHVLVTIPAFQHRDAIAHYLGLTRRKVSEALAFLESTGLIQEEGGRVKAGVTRLFLGSDSPMIARHHTNWRLRAVESLARENGADIHLSTLLSISSNDLLRLKEQIIAGIETARGIARESSPEEELHCFCVDFFKV